MAREDRNEHPRRYGAREIPTTLSHAPVATRTLSVVEKRGGSNRSWLVGVIVVGAAAAAGYSAVRVTPTNTSAPPVALARPTVVAPTAAAKAAPVNAATISLEASASPSESTLYLDGKALPSNPYIGRIAADDSTHLLRAEAPGYASTTRSFLANREVAIILALAKITEPPPVEVKRVVRPTSGPAPVTPTKSSADDCSVSPYYVDDRNIKVVRPECRRAIQSP
jgi:hypothetical protein